MRKFVKYPSSYVQASADTNKVWVDNLPEDKQLLRLNIPASQVSPRLLENVTDDNDRAVLQHLIDEKAVPTAVSSPDMRNNPYYQLEDKLISLLSYEGDHRVYEVPYPGSGRFGSGKIYTKTLAVYDDGMIQIGSGKLRDPYALKGSTLRSAFYRD